mgnify:CR=1 FL=1
MQNWNIFESNPLGPKVREVSLRERERLFFLMAQMLRAGQTAEGSLRAVAKAFKAEKQDKIALALNSIAQKVSQGRPLSKAAESEPVLFDDVHRAAMLAGEASNSMYNAFRTLQELEAKKMQMRRAGLAEVITPAALWLLSLASLFNTGLNTLPALSAMKEAQGEPLGLIAQTIMSFTQFMASNWYILLALVVVMVVVLYSVVKTPQGKFWVDAYILKIPGLGKFMAYKVYTNMLLYFPSMIESGVKPKQMIPIMEALATNIVLKRKIEYFNQVLTAGGKMSQAMEKAGFPPISVTPIRVSEHYAGSDSGVNDVMVEGMRHSYSILDRDLNDAQRKFVTVAATILWILGGSTMLLEMLSIVMAQT